jgi:hypothetical protein
MNLQVVVGGLLAGLQLILPATSNNFSPISCLSSLVRLYFITFFLLLHLRNSLLFTFPLLFLSS